MKRLLLIICFLLSLSIAADAAREDFVIQTPVFSRTVSKLGGFLKTVQLQAYGVEVLAHPTVEFLIEIERDGELVLMVPGDFKTDRVRTDKLGREMVTRARLLSQKERLPLTVNVSYYSDPLTNRLEKSIEIEANGHPETTILKRIVIEDLRLAAAFAPLTPAGFAATDADDGAAVPAGRFRTDVPASFAAMDSKSGLGLFFFVPALAGEERVKTNRDLLMAESMDLPLRTGYTTARAVIGAVKGGPEITYRRFREYVTSFCTSGSGAKCGVEFHPQRSESPRNAAALATEMDAISKLGFFDGYRLDDPWKDPTALVEDPARFPDGLPALAERAKSLGLRLTYPIHAADGTSPALPDEQLVRLVTECGAGALEIRGAHLSGLPARSRVNALLRLRTAVEKLRSANKDVEIRMVTGDPVAASDLHLLSVADQVRFQTPSSDNGTATRRERYLRAFVYPLFALGVGGANSGPQLPLAQMKYAILSGASNCPQVQASRQISDPDPVVADYLREFYAFRDRFAQYFDVYQHVLDVPDGARVDGEAHIIDNRGFLLLFNPSESSQKVTLPLDEPGLELKGRLKLSDWTALESAAGLGEAEPGDAVEVQIEPMSAKVIGINIAS